MGLPFLLSTSRRQSSITSYVQRVQGFFLTKNRRVDAVGSFREKSCQASQASGKELFANLDPLELAPKTKYPLAGVKYLPGSHGEGFPKFLAFPRQGLPQAFKIQHADQFTITEWAQHCRKLLDEELLKYGAVLFRGLPLTKGEHFSLFANALGYPPMGYEGGIGDRPAYDQKAHTFVSSAETMGNNVEFHNEMAYWPFYPQKVIFYCDDEPEEGCGGLTPITRNSEVLARLDPKVVQKFEEKQVRYIRTLPSEANKDYLTWQNTFKTDDRKEVEKKLEEGGSSYKWNTDDSLFYWQNLPTTIHHPKTGEKVWFNQVTAHHCTYLKFSPMLEGITFESDSQYPTHSTYGDGTEIEPEVLQHIREISWKCAVGFQWKNSDMLVVDNLKAMHARLSYTGKRRILVYMTSE